MLSTFEEAWADGAASSVGYNLCPVRCARRIASPTGQLPSWRSTAWGCVTCVASRR